MLPISNPTFKNQPNLLDIIYIYNEGQTTWTVFFDEQTQRCVALSGSIDNWEKRLPKFWRINESYLINPALIYRFHPAELPHFPLPLVELVTGRTLAVSRKKVSVILQKWARLQQVLLS